jgi:hypothetical protein
LKTPTRHFDRWFFFRGPLSRRLRSIFASFQARAVWRRGRSGRRSQAPYSDFFWSNRLRARAEPTCLLRIICRKSRIFVGPTMCCCCATRSRVVWDALAGRWRASMRSTALRIDAGQGARWRPSAPVSLLLVRRDVMDVFTPAITAARSEEIRLLHQPLVDQHVERRQPNCVHSICWSSAAPKSASNRSSSAKSSSRISLEGERRD